MLRTLSFAVIGLATVVSCGGKTDLFGSQSGGGGSTSGPGGSSSGGSSGTSAGGVGSGGVGSTPASTAIACGQTSCNVATQECCIETPDSPGVCTSKGNGCNGLALTCASAANCTNGEVCCVAFDGSSQSSVCAASCDNAGSSSSGGSNGGPGDPGDGPGDGPGGLQLCATDAECVQGQSCQRTSLGFGICVDRRGGGGGGRPQPPRP
jgi:hypothetical protein